MHGMSTRYSEKLKKKNVICCIFNKQFKCQANYPVHVLLDVCVDVKSF